MNLERDKVYMEHILECIDKINNYTGKDRARFMGNEFVQDAVLRRLQIMAESTQRLSDDLKATALDIDWRALSGFRNILVHDYLVAIALKHGAFNVRVFGSVARGEETENSDIDFLIDYDIKKISPWFPAGLIGDLEILLGKKVDVVSAKCLHYFIKDRVLAEAIAL